MAGDFVSLEELLRPPAGDPPAPSAAVDPAGVAPIAAPPDDTQADALAAVRAARLFRARLGDALEAAAARLLRELACDVLARELRLAPCDLDALLRRLIERAPAVRVRVAVEDVARVKTVACVADPTLAPGDAVVEVEGGTLDARLGVRLATVLEGFA